METADGLDLQMRFLAELSFAEPLIPWTIGFDFNGKKVHAFGVQNPALNAVKTLEILYYKNDRDFAIKLKTKDSTQELILVRGLNVRNRFVDAWNQFNSVRKVADKEKSARKDEWRFEFNDGDELTVPTIKFNMVKEFDELRDHRFYANGVRHSVINVSQRNAFILNEKGVKVESEVFTSYDSAGEPPKHEKPHPKHLVFDKPFILFMRNSDSRYPYLAIKIKDDLLLDPFK